MDQSQRASDQGTGKCTDWEAWHDRMPGGPATLHVTGKCEFPTDGYSVELRPVEPQGINPAVYMLERIVHEPTGPVPEVITTEDVHYTEHTESRYTHVHILPDNVTVEVKEVS